MTVSELGTRMSSAELTEWVAYFKLENADRKKKHDTNDDVDDD